MPILKVKLKNCYGIRELDEEFSFDISQNITDKTKTYSIYAPNGAMKSSFAGTFYAIQEVVNGEPRDRIYPERKTECNITWDGAKIAPEKIYVIEPFSEKKIEEPSTGVARLLANGKLKKRYDEEYKKLDIQKNEFVKKLQRISKSTDCESELIATFSKVGDNKTIFEILGNIVQTTAIEKYPTYSFKYNDVFDKAGKVKEFVLKHKGLLQEYANTYDRLLSESNFFSKESSFGTYQANKIQLDIKGGEFFDAGHKFKLKDSDHDIQSQNEFSEVIKKEIDRIITNRESKDAFNKIDSALHGNQGLRNFQSALSRDNVIAAKIIDYDDFRAEVWYGYMSEIIESLHSLVNAYEEIKPEIDKILKEASYEQMLWKDSIDEFNFRFKNLPFRLNITNQRDVILSTKTPVVKFEFDDSYGDDGREAEPVDLVKVLSRGELRALYLLNIIFDVKARQIDNQETLFIIDDIVDSFDYKNKYAIIQYLKDIANVKNFYQIILTHNFDFFRTIESRGVVNYSDCRIAYKCGQITKLKQIINFKKPFDYWKKKLAIDQKMLIASIPFVRNIIEYITSDDCDEYIELTKMLHIKKDSLGLTIGDLNRILIKTFDDISVPSNDSELIYEIIIKNAQDCLRPEVGELELEGKIVLSIAARIVAEKYMRAKISEAALEELEMEKNQTAKMIELYKKENPKATKEILAILDDVILKTPENIHLNAFMYEPIVDMGSDELRELFKTTNETLV